LGEERILNEREGGRERERKREKERERGRVIKELDENMVRV
jgi:hypothetical protein